MRRILALLSLALLVVLGCNGTPTGGATDPKIVEAQKQLPFELVLPGYLPAGYEFAEIKVEDEPPVGTKVDVEIVYKNRFTGSFTVQESNYAARLGGNEVEKVKVGMKDGDYQEIKRSDATLRSVVFQATEKVSVTIITMSLDRDELLKVAASMLQ